MEKKELVDAIAKGIAYHYDNKKRSEEWTNAEIGRYGSAALEIVEEYLLPLIGLPDPNPRNSTKDSPNIHHHKIPTEPVPQPKFPTKEDADQGKEKECTGCSNGKLFTAIPNYMSPGEVEIIYCDKLERLLTRGKCLVTDPSPQASEEEDMEASDMFIPKYEHVPSVKESCGNCRNLGTYEPCGDGRRCSHYGYNDPEGVGMAEEADKEKVDCEQYDSCEDLDLCPCHSYYRQEGHIDEEDPTQQDCSNNSPNIHHHKIPTEPVPQPKFPLKEEGLSEKEKEINYNEIFQTLNNRRHPLIDKKLKQDGKLTILEHKELGCITLAMEQLDYIIGEKDPQAPSDQGKEKKLEIWKRDLAGYERMVEFHKKEIAKLDPNPRNRSTEGSYKRKKKCPKCGYKIQLGPDTIEDCPECGHYLYAEQGE